MNNFTKEFLSENITIIQNLDTGKIDKIVSHLKNIRERGGRLFVLGVGGSAGTASHSVNDFRKICQIETYTPTDNVSELTARTNDDGWENSYVDWLKVSRLKESDGVLILSVGGGNQEKNISVNLIKSLELAKSVNATTLGIVGKDGGFTKKVADACVVIPPLFKDHITPNTEGLCSVILHLIVSHPLLKVESTKWESVK